MLIFTSNKLPDTFKTLHNKGYNKSKKIWNNSIKPKFSGLNQDFLYEFYNPRSISYKAIREDLSPDYDIICFSKAMETFLWEEALVFYKPKQIYLAYDTYDGTFDPIGNKDRYISWKTPKDWLEWVMMKEWSEISEAFRYSNNKDKFEEVKKSFKDISDNYGLNWNYIISSKDNYIHNNWD